MKPLYSSGLALNLDASAWGPLRESSLETPPDVLSARMEDEGYLFIRDFFPRSLIEKARQSILQALVDNGTELLRESGDSLGYSGHLAPNAKVSSFSPEVTRANPSVQRVVFGPEIKAFYKNLLGGAIRHFDYVWARTIGPGLGTPPHCDLVYMGRGTRDLYTAWIPYGDVSFEIGGLMILEGSLKQQDRFRNYLDSDVDAICTNRPESARTNPGHLSKNPVSLQEKLGGRWLSAEYRMGDLLTFRMETVHASLDNQTSFVRLSTDTRYQRSDAPVDERWVGENPIGHGPQGKRHLIC